MLSKFAVIFAVMAACLSWSTLAAAQESRSGSKPKASVQAELSEVLQELGRAYAQKQYATALVHCERAMALESDVPELMLMCLQLYMQNERQLEALSLSQQIHARFPEVARSASLCFVEATLYTKLERWDEAVESYSRCPELEDEAYGTTLSNLAELEMIRGRLSESIAKYDVSLGLFPNNPHAYFGQVVALVRHGDWRLAESRFLEGVSYDPDLKFLREAFFVPEGEPHFHRAVLAIFSRRYDVAAFELAQYVSKEQRVNYREIGKAMVKRLLSVSRTSNPLLGAYPVLLDMVDGIAIDASGRFLAFAERKSGAVWILDTETGRVNRRLEQDQYVRGMSFVEGTAELRLVTRKQRIAFDASDFEEGYTYYENYEAFSPVGLMPQGDEVLNATTEGRICTTAFLDETHCQEVTLIPNDTRRVVFLPDFSRMLIVTTRSVHLVDVMNDRLIESRISDHMLSSIAAHPRRAIFALGMSSATLLVDSEGRVLARLASQGELPVVSLAFDPMGRYLVTLSGTLLEVWDVELALRPQVFAFEEGSE